MGLIYRVLGFRVIGNLIQGLLPRVFNLRRLVKGTLGFRDLGLVGSRNSRAS